MWKPSAAMAPRSAPAGTTTEADAAQTSDFPGRRSLPTLPMSPNCSRMEVCPGNRNRCFVLLNRGLSHLTARSSGRVWKQPLGAYSRINQHLGQGVRPNGTIWRLRDPAVSPSGNALVTVPSHRQLPRLPSRQWTLHG